MAVTSPEQKRRIWGWYAYDWASQPFYTLLLTFIFGPYFAAIAAQFFMGQGLESEAARAAAQSKWSDALTIIGLLIAFTAPILGAFADGTGRRMPWIALFSMFYVVGAAGLWWMVPDGSFIWGTLIFFGIVMIGVEYANIFTNALLPSLGKTDDIGELSGTGYAVGYVGGVLSLFVMLLVFAENADGLTLLGNPPAFGLNGVEREGTRLVGPLTAIWFAVFMIPFFLWVKEPRTAPQPGGFSTALSDLFRTLKNLRHRPSLAAYLGSSMLYRDALNGLYAFGGVYAALVLDWSITQIGVFGIVGAITAAICTYIGGKLDSRHGPKPVIVWGAVVLTLVAVVIVGMDRSAIFGLPFAEGSGLPDVIFYVLGAIIGGVGGAMQGASRTMMVRHANPDRPTEAFGLFAFSGKATAFLAPWLIGVSTMYFESARLGLMPLIGLFLLALILLVWVNPDGDRAQPWSDVPAPA